MNVLVFTLPKGVEQIFTERFPISHHFGFQVFCPQNDQQGGFYLPPSSPWFPCILSPKREVRQRWVTVHFIVLTRSINRTRSSTQLHLQFHFDLTSDIFHPGASFQIVMMKFFKMSKLSRNHLKGKVPPVFRRVTPFHPIWLSPIT